MLKYRKIRTSFSAIVLLCAATLLGQDRLPEFYFGGKRIYVGMSQTDALAALSTCCRLSPTNVTPEQQRTAAKIGRMAGQLILPIDDSAVRILGTIYFERGRVLSVSRPLGEEAYVPWNEDVLGFARTLERALSRTTGNSEVTIHVSIRHERSSNAETEVLSLTFPDGRGVRLSLISLDKPFEGAPPNSRNQAGLDEFLDQPWHP